MGTSRATRAWRDAPPFPGRGTGWLPLRQAHSFDIAEKAGIVGRQQGSHGWSALLSGFECLAQGPVTGHVVPGCERCASTKKGDF